MSPGGVIGSGGKSGLVPCRAGACAIAKSRLQGKERCTGSSSMRSRRDGMAQAPDPTLRELPPLRIKPVASGQPFRGLPRADS
jgi:hypothetical protein